MLDHLENTNLLSYADINTLYTIKTSHSLIFLPLLLYIWKGVKFLKADLRFPNANFCLKAQIKFCQWQQILPVVP